MALFFLPGLDSNSLSYHAIKDQGYLLLKNYDAFNPKQKKNLRTFVCQKGNNMLLLLFTVQKEVTD